MLFLRSLSTITISRAQIKSEVEKDEEMLHAIKNDAHSKSCKTKQKEKHLWFNKRRYQKVIKNFIIDILKKFPPDT